MNYEKAARVFVDGLRKIGVEPLPSVGNVAHRMWTLNSHGLATIEVQRWHEEVGHPKVGAHRCQQCLAKR